MNVTPYENWSICRAGGLSPLPEVPYTIGRDLRPGAAVRVAAVRVAADSDAYPPEERALRITRALLEEFVRIASGLRLSLEVVVRTRFDLVRRDLDLIDELGAAVEVPLLTLKPSLAAGLEPGSSSPGSRLALLRRLAGAGIDVGVAVDPVLPGMTDRLGTLENVIGAAASAGAKWVSARGLRLPIRSRNSFYGFLARERPGLVRRYRARFDGEGEPPKFWEERVLDMVNLLRSAAGLAAGPGFARECEHVVVPESACGRSGPGEPCDSPKQLSLPFAAAAAAGETPGPAPARTGREVAPAFGVRTA